MREERKDLPEGQHEDNEVEGGRHVRLDVSGLRDRELRVGIID